MPSRVLTCTPVELSRERRETLGVEVRGWFGAEAATWLRMLAGQRASDVQAAMRAGARATWVARWSGLLAVAAQRAVAASLLELPLAGECNVAGEALELREAHAFAMVDACHLHSWTVYVMKFMHFYARKPAEHFHPPAVLEAEVVDRVVLEEVFQLCFSGHTLRDALSHVIVDRDMLRHVLVERPKIGKVDKPDKPPSFSALPPLHGTSGQPLNDACFGASSGPDEFQF
eukprot:s572_g23.t1